MLNLLHAALHGGKLRLQLGLGLVELGIGFLLGAFELAFRGVQRGAAVVILGAAIAQFLLAVGKQLLVGGNLGAAGDDFIPRRQKLALGLVALLQIFGVGFVIVGHAVVQFGFGVADQGFKALARLRLAGGGHLILVLFHAALVFVGIDFPFGIQAHVDLGIVIAIKALIGDVGKGQHRSVAQRGAAPLVIHIGWRVAQADDGIFIIGEHIQRIFIVGGGNAHGGADAVHREKRGVDHHFIGGAGQTAGGEADFVDVLGERMEHQNAGKVQRFRFHQRILADGARGG